MSAESMPEPIPQTGAQEPGRGGRGRRRKPRGTGRKALLATAWTAAGVLVLGGAGAGYLYFKLNGNLHSVDINQVLGKDRPTKIDNGSENIWSSAPTPAPAPTRSSAAARTTAAPAPTPR